jgi:hypothetical protein
VKREAGRPEKWSQDDDVERNEEREEADRASKDEALDGLRGERRGRLDRTPSLRVIEGFASGWVHQAASVIM